MPKPALNIEGVMRGGDLYRRQQEARGEWSLAELSGRIVELSGDPANSLLTVSMGLVLEAQRAGEPVAWVAADEATFFPPDAADHGVDLAALPVVRVAGARKAGRAADKLLRSGAFGLVIIDLPEQASLPTPLMRRLQTLAEEHDSALLCLTRKPEGAPSLGSFVSLRGIARRERVGDDRFKCRVDIVRDKRRAPGWSWEEECCGPPGLR
ncbi:MAG: recombinase A [Myxococcota bacterium]